MEGLDPRYHPGEQRPSEQRSHRDRGAAKRRRQARANSSRDTPPRKVSAPRLRREAGDETGLVHANAREQMEAGGKGKEPKILIMVIHFS